MNYTDISNKKLDNHPTGNYGNYLNIRDENATGETLSHFFDIGEDNQIVTNLTIISKKLKVLPEGIFKYLKKLKSIHLYQCEALEAVEDIMVANEAISLTITSSPQLMRLSDAIWNSTNLSALKLDNLPKLEIPFQEKEENSFLTKGLKLFQKSVGQPTEAKWNFPKMTSLSLINVPIKRLPFINAVLMYSLNIQCDSFVGFDSRPLNFPKLRRVTIKSKVFEDIKKLEYFKGLDNLNLTGIETTLNWSEIVENCFATFLTFKECTSFSISKEATPNSRIRILSLENCNVTALPDFIGECRGLNQLILKNCPIATLPKRLAIKKEIAGIYINQCQFKEIPPVIFEMPLEHFYLQNNKTPISDFPKNWSGCSNLLYLDLSNNNISFSDLDFLNSLPQLKSLKIEGNTLENKYSLLLKKKLPLEKESYSIFKDCKYTKRAEIVAVCRALANAPISKTDQHYFLDTIWTIKKMSDFPAVSDEILLKGLCVGWSPMQTHFVEILAKRIEAHNQNNLRFDANSIVYPIGKLTLKKSELKAQIEDLGATYSTKFSTKVTHVILGKYPKQFDLFDYKNIHLCTEAQFQSYLAQLNPSFLEENESGEDNVMMQNLYLLLQNPDPANFEIAMAILKNGGVPNGMLEDLLILQKTHESAQVRSQIKDLLKLYGPAEWLPILQDKHNFCKLAQGKEQEWVVTKKLRKIAVQTAPKYAVILSILLYKKFGKGLRYALLQQGKVEPTLYDDIIESLVKNGILDWSKAIGMRQDEQLNYAGEYAHSYYTSAAKIPTQLLKDTPISTINFYDCGLKKLPKEVFAFAEIVKLNLGKNQLTELPLELKKLKKLEELDLSDNQLSVFPAIVFQLKNLKSLNLLENPLSGEMEELKEKLKLELPNCKMVKI